MTAFRRFAVGVLALAGLAGFASAQTAYQNVALTTFRVAKGVDFPADYQKALIDSLVQQFTDSKKFTKVARPGAATPAGRTLKVTGVVTHIEKGNQPERQVAGVFGAGKATVTAHVKLIDAASGRVKLESDVTSSYEGSIAFTGDKAFGGKPINVARSLAKDIVKMAVDKL
jgi:hypothetical protein